MARVSLARPDLYPPGTVVEVVAGPRVPADGGSPVGVVVASGAVDENGLLVIEDAALEPYTIYIAYAVVGGEHRCVRVRSTAERVPVGRT